MQLSRRPRRLRASTAVRELVAETGVEPRRLILPVFVAEGIDTPRPISSMPGVVQHTLDSLRQTAAASVAAGLGGIMLFGVPEYKDAVGSGAVDPDGILAQGLRAVHQEVGDDLVIMSDVCLDEFTDHGHCGLVTASGEIDNDATVERYVDMARLHAECGVHMVGPSGMMDGQVAAIRVGLDAVGRTDVSILAYTAKYASAYYGPFREAVASSLQGDRKTYQQDPANARESMVEAELDLAEGADVLMVKPALGYLDVVARLRDRHDVPIAAYNVSGEYSMVEAAAERGWLDRDRTIAESLLSIRRAGADLVLSYWALEYAQRMYR